MESPRTDLPYLQEGFINFSGRSKAAFLPPTEGHPSDRLVDPYMVADNTFENETGEKMVDLGDGFYNLDTGEGYRNLSREETEYLANIFPIKPQGTIQVKAEQDELYLQRNGERIEITEDPDFNFGHFFPEFEAIAGGTAKSIEEHESGIGTKVGIALLSLGILGAGVAGYSLMDMDSDHDGLKNYEEWTGPTSWRNPDTDHDRAYDSMDPNPAKSNPVIKKATDLKLSQETAIKLNNSGVEDVYEFLKGIEKLDSEYEKKVVKEFLGNIETTKVNLDDYLQNAIYGNADNEGPNNFEEVVKYGANPLDNDTSNDGISDGRLIEMGLDPTEEHPTVKYALENLKPKYAAEFSGTNLDNNLKTFISFISKIPENYRGEAIDSFLPEGINENEKRQMEALVQLPPEDLNQYASNHSLADLDPDNDDFSTPFEVMVNESDPLQSNDRYFILLSPYSDFYITESFLKDYEIPENSIIKLAEDNATYEKFSSALNRVDSITDKNDQVFIAMASHGGPEGISLYDKPLSYGDDFSPGRESLDEMLDDLESTTVVAINSCYSGRAIPRASSEDRVIMTQTTADQVSPYASYIYNYLIRDLRDDNADLDGNGYVSLGEAFRHVKETEMSGPQMAYLTPQISNLDIANKIYLVEKEVRKDL